MEILGVSHPIPPIYAERIYKKAKDVFVCKLHLGKVSKGDKFVIYESYDAKAYTGWADIKSISKEKSSLISKKYGQRLMLTSEELKEYSKGKDEMNVIVFEHFEKFNTPVKPERFVSIGGKYIYEDEYKMIDKNKGWIY